MKTRVERIIEDIKSLFVTEYNELLEELNLVPNNVDQMAHAMKYFQQMINEERGITLKEVASQLNISYCTALSYVKQGFIKPIKGTKRYHMKEIRGFDKEEMMRVRRNRNTYTEPAGTRVINKKTTSKEVAS